MGADPRASRSSLPGAADFAGPNAAIAWRRRYLEWTETGLPRTSTDLLARLPFDDAVKLAALVGTGQMTWPEINAALDAMIKLAAADALDGALEDERHASPTQHTAKATCENEIWARYHAQCDEVFANEGGPSELDDRSQLWATEQVLDRLRSIRDRELATLRQQLEQPLGPASSAIRLQQKAMPWTELSPSETRALGKLGATGFAASEGMMAAVGSLVGEIASGA
ncbi:hypothetical protein [Dongia deserti]|uniref:hypothetical protein n=1 Tax=Dongia deserti TaxID=2268030 RepID=UPI000E6522B5|nr:hypothetical protein [Dongia deserti]